MSFTFTSIHFVSEIRHMVSECYIVICLPWCKGHLDVRWCPSCVFLSPAGGGVILYASSSGSASPSPGSPSSGYQTQSPSSHSQPSSPEDVTFTEIGALKQTTMGCTTTSSKLVFQFPEVYSGPSSAAPATPQHTYNIHPIAGKRPCGLSGTFTSKF